MNLLLIFLASVLWQDPTPYKANEEFELKLNFEFKERQRGDHNKVELDQTRKEQERSRGSGPLPYLFLNFRVLKQQPSEMRIRVIENNAKVAINNKKIDPNTVVKLELGFTDDIKDHVGAYEFTILLLNDDKQPVSRVVIFFQSDGTYLVNGQTRGKI